MKSFKDIPGPKRGQVIFNFWKGRVTGNLCLYQTFQRYWDEFGDIVKIDTGSSRPPLICVFRPDLAETFLRAAGPVPNRPGFEGIKVRRDLDAENQGNGHAKGLLTSQGSDWREFRRQVQQPLLKVPLKEENLWQRHLDVANEFIDKCVRPGSCKKNLSTNQDFLDHLYKWALESVCSTLFHKRIGCMDVDQAKNNPAVQMIDALQRVLKKGQLLDGGTGLWKRKPECSRLFQSFSADYHLFRRLANETCFQSDDGPSKKVTSIMSKLKNDYKCDEATLRALSEDLIFAGIDTTSHTVAFALYFLSKNPEAQAKLRVESNGSFCQPGSYVRAVIKETLRMRCPAIGVIRNIKTPLEIGGFNVDRPALYFSLNLNMCNSPRYFTHPEIFDPGRWIKDGSSNVATGMSDTPPHPFLMLPFGNGPRTCVGKRIAVDESAALLTRMVERFEIEWDGQRQLGMRVEGLTKPDGPLRFKLSER